MTDHLNKKKRSWNMSQIQSKDSLAEIKVRSALHAAGYQNLTKNIGRASFNAILSATLEQKLCLRNCIGK